MQSIQDAKEQIRRSIDLVDLVSEHVTLKRAGRNLKGLCPFHRENTPSFNVLPDRQIFKCFGCNAAGDLFKFIQLREGVGFGDAVRILADRIGLDLRPAAKDAQGTPQIGRADIARANEWAAQWFQRELNSDRGASARAYLQKRHITEESAERFQLGAAIPGGRFIETAGRSGTSVSLLLAADLLRTGESGGLYETFRDRLIFPIRDASKRCVAFGGRTLIDAPAKYLNTAQTALFDKGRCLFGLDQARNDISQRGEVVVVEGYTDCIACHQHGFRHVIATLGTAATEEHMSMLRRYVDNIILFFDSDAAGNAAAERAAAVAMQQNLRVRLSKVPEGKDPAEYLEGAGSGGFEALLNSAVDALGFLWDRTLARFQNPSEGQGRRRAVVEFVQLVGELGRFRAVDAIQRGMIINQVARLLALPVQEVAGFFQQPAQAGAAKLSSAATLARSRSSLGRSLPVGDAEQTALREMWGILLCRPDLRVEVREVFRPERFDDAGLPDVVEQFMRMGSAEISGDLSVLLASIESPDVAATLTDLMMRASDRGNFEETLASLRHFLAVMDSERPRREASRALLGVERPPSALNDDEINAQLTALHEGFAQRHRFSPVVVSGSTGLSGAA